MMRKTERIAFYGKRGIGKSTIASNVSAILALDGRRGLHIGCDPKSDSTCTLMGRKVPTVLEQQLKYEGRVKREDIMFHSESGVWCIETGGPKAGKGCAGLGITAMADELERLGILKEDWDAIVYDVLGDVVCGGFAMPMRKYYVDKVYVVTSADYMSLYAANNIMRGVASYSAGGVRFAGIVLNHSKGRQDEKIVEKFAESTGTTICARIEESDDVKTADYRQKLLCQLYPDSTAGETLRGLAEHTKSEFAEKMIYPLGDMQMESFREEVSRMWTCERE